MPIVVVFFAKSVQVEKKEQKCRKWKGNKEEKKHITFTKDIAISLSLHGGLKENLFAINNPEKLFLKAQVAIARPAELPRLGMNTKD